VLGTKHLTDTPEPQRRTAPGMAFWSGSGPAGKTCGDCVHLGYWASRLNRSGAPTGSRRSKGCAKYHALTGVHGPAINPCLLACKYFAARSAQ
jgi:hypothetical protein